MINGQNIIGYQYSGRGRQTFTAINPATNTALPDAFSIATLKEINQAMALANSAFPIFSNFSAAQRADFLETIGREILELGDELIQTAHLETALPIARLQGERGRTIGQLNMFAGLLREGSYVNAVIDTALPERQPIPRPDLRKMQVGLGPIVVFGASNFPLAFSVAGVDTASAFAAGCPVLVKAHPAHPGTSALIGQAIKIAAEKTGMPDGVFSLLYDQSVRVARSLIQHPVAKGVGFTGSRRAGMILHNLAQKRSEPIPMFAEMGSVNPVILLPEMLAQKGNDLALALANSINLGAGQFCTNPGLVFVLETPTLAEFLVAYRNAVLSTQPATMLTPGICKAYTTGKKDITTRPEVAVLAEVTNSEGTNVAQATVATVGGSDFIKNPKLHEEVFGPFSLLVICQNETQLLEALNKLDGQLTMTVWGNEEEMSARPELLQVMAEKAGRVIRNGVPTGVEVSPAMQHGGPFPAASDSRFTSVGTDAVKRWLRPVCFQNWPDELLPPALQQANPLKIWRLVNGEMTK